MATGEVKLMTFDIRQEVVRSLAQAVRRGGHSLDSVPALLRRVIEENMWQERQIGEGEKITLSEFREFVETDYPEGLGTTLDTLEALCKLEPDIMDYLAQAKRGKVGAPLGNKNRAKSVYKTDARGNVTQIAENNSLYYNELKTSSNQGTSAEYAYQRLRDEAYNEDGTVKNPDVADIHKRVIAGEISPHAGMVEAGFRKRKVAVNMDDVESAARTITRYMDQDSITYLIDLLQNALYQDQD